MSVNLYGFIKQSNAIGTGLGVLLHKILGNTAAGGALGGALAAGGLSYLFPPKGKVKQADKIKHALLMSLAGGGAGAAGGLLFDHFNNK